MMKIKLGLFLFSTAVASESSEELSSVRSYPFKSAVALVDLIVQARKHPQSGSFQTESERIIVSTIESYINRPEITNKEIALFNRYLKDNGVELIKFKK